MPGLGITTSDMDAIFGNDSPMGGAQLPIPEAGLPLPSSAAMASPEVGEYSLNDFNFDL